MPDAWYSSYAKIQSFGRALYQAKVLENIDELFDYLARPRDYDEAYQYWEELGSPTPKDKEWQTWVDSLDVTVEDV